MLPSSSAERKREKRPIGDVSRPLRVGVFCLCVAAPHPGSARQVVDMSRPVASSASVRPTIGLAWYDPERLLSGDRDGVAEGLARMAERFGVTARLMDGGTLALQPAPVEMKVVLIRYPCRSPKSGRRILGAFLGGAPILVGDRSLGTITLFVMNLLRAIGSRREELRKPLCVIRFSLREPEQRWRIDRALARVIFHEAVHGLAPGVEHTDTGLMRETMIREDLDKPEIEIQPHVIAAFRSGVAAAIR